MRTISPGIPDSTLVRSNFMPKKVKSLFSKISEFNLGLVLRLLIRLGLVVLICNSYNYSEVNIRRAVQYL